MIVVEWLLLGRCAHSPEATAHLVPDAVARTLDPKRITLADFSVKPCPRTDSHIVHTYDVTEKTP